MGKKFKWMKLDARAISNLLVVLIGILFYLAVSNIGQLKGALNGFISIIAPFLAAFVVAYLLSTPVNFFERTIFKKMRWRRACSISLTYVLAITILVILISMVVPSLFESVVSLVSNIESNLVRINGVMENLLTQRHLEGFEWVNLLMEQFMESYQEIIQWGTTKLNEMLPRVFDFGIAVGSGFITGITAFIASIYMLTEKEHLKGQMKKLSYAFLPRTNADSMLEVFRYANKIFNGFISGKLIDSAIIGILCFIICSILGIPFAILVSVVIGITNIIPFFGPFIGGIPCVIILLIVDPWSGLKFGILIIALQQFDGNILGPKILGDSTGLSPLWVLISIIVGGGLFGFLGMLLGVPTFAVIYALLRTWLDKRLAERGLRISGDDVEEIEEDEVEEEAPTPTE